MANTLHRGAQVTWKWGSGISEGKIAEVFHEKVIRTIEGKAITRNGNEDEPAYLIEQEDGGRVLKLHSEVEPASKK